MAKTKATLTPQATFDRPKAPKANLDRPVNSLKV